MIYLIPQYLVYINSHQISIISTNPFINTSSHHGNNKLYCHSLQCQPHLHNFIIHFQKLYSYSIDFNLYNYHYDNDGQLILISIPNQNKHKLLSTLTQNANFSTFKIKNKFTKSYLTELKSPMIDRKNKFLYLPIPKDSCTLFVALFWGIYKNISKGLGYYIDKGIHTVTVMERIRKMSLKNFIQYENYLQDESYVKIVIIRDPLQRLLSAYLDKCNYEWRIPKSIVSPSMCADFEFVGGESEYNGTYNNYQLFNMFLDWLQPQLLNDKWMNFQLKRHFGYHYTFGALNYYLLYFDYILFFNQDHNLINATKYMLEFAHDGNFSHFWYHWNGDWIKNGYTEPMDDYEMLMLKTRYSNHSGNSMIYANYYNQENLNKAYELYQEEYQYLPFEPPVS